MGSESLPDRYLSDADVQLMLRFTGGDEAAFAQLVSKYQDRIVGFFFHLLYDRQAAEDLAQEVFLRVFRARERYQPTARFSTWVFRIAHNLAINERRDNSRRHEVSLPLSGDSRDPGNSQEMPAEKSALMPSRRFDVKEIRDVVRRALDELGERQKTVVLLHKFEGLSYEDIGEIMGLGTVAVKSLLSRARTKLRDSLEKYL